MTKPTKKLDVLCLGIFVADTLAKPIERMPQWRQLTLVDQVELAEWIMKNALTDWR